MKSDYFKDIDKVFEKYSTVLKRNIQTELSWTDNLKNLIDVNPEGTSVVMTMPLYGWVVNTGRRGVNYDPPKASSINPFGWDGNRPPRVPPPEKLHGWMEKMGIPLEADWKIAISIYYNGIKARPWVEKAVVVPQLMEAIANKIVYNMIREIEIKENEGKFIQGRIPANKNTFK